MPSSGTRYDLFCTADEHYVPTLLASLGLENETYCRGWGLAYTDWSDNWIHPKSFKWASVCQS